MKQKIKAITVGGLFLMSSPALVLAQTETSASAGVSVTSTGLDVDASVKAESKICTREYMPVCAQTPEGLKTFSNDCMAGDFEIVSQGVCEDDKEKQKDKSDNVDRKKEDRPEVSDDKEKSENTKADIEAKNEAKLVLGQQIRVLGLKSNLQVQVETANTINAKLEEKNFEQIEKAESLTVELQAILDQVTEISVENSNSVEARLQLNEIQSQAKNTSNEYRLLVKDALSEEEKTELKAEIKEIKLSAKEELKTEKESLVDKLHRLKAVELLNRLPESEAKAELILKLESGDSLTKAEVKTELKTFLKENKKENVQKLKEEYQKQKIEEKKKYDERKDKYEEKRAELELKIKARQDELKQKLEVRIKENKKEIVDRIEKIDAKVIESIKANNPEIAEKIASGEISADTAAEIYDSLTPEQKAQIKAQIKAEIGIRGELQ